MENTFDLLTRLIRSAVTGEKLDLPSESEYDFDALIKLAKAHDIRQIIAYALLNNGFIGNKEKKNLLKGFMFHASYRDTKNADAYEIAKSALNKAEIPFMPLKGIIIKKLYTESFLRSSCDIDVLVHREDISRAVRSLAAEGFETDGRVNYHDISLLYGKANLELHFSVCEDIDFIDLVLKDVWNYAVKVGEFEYREANDYFVFHHIAHMAKHFISGGCGIRPFVDLWILRRSNYYDENKVKEFCRKAGILKFYDAVVLTVNVWFEGADTCDVVDRIQKYTVDGGAYGASFNDYAAHTVKSGGKCKHIFLLIFPRFITMRELYPVLAKAPFLLPYFYVYRGFQKLFGRGRARIGRKLVKVALQDNNFINHVSLLLEELDLKK